MTIFHELEGDPTKNKKNTGKNMGKTQGEHSRTSPITHPLDSNPHKIHKGTRTTKGKRYMLEFIPNPMGRWGLESTRDLP